MLLGGVVHAQTVATKLSQGLWKTEYRVLVNGQDSAMLLNQANTQLNSSLPQSLKAGAKVALNSDKSRGTASVCLTSPAASTLTTPSQVFAMFAKMNPKCTLVAGSPTANSVPFMGRCDDATSFSGNVQGLVKINSPISWNADISGLGRIPDTMLTALKLPSKSLVRVQTSSTNRWVSATCS